MPSDGYVGDDSSGDEPTMSPSESPDDEYDNDLPLGFSRMEEVKEPQCPLDEEDIIGSVTIRWNIPHFDQQPTKLYSEPEMLEGDRWRILCFPQGNQAVYLPHSMSVFVDFMDAKEQSEKNAEWRRYAWFYLCVRSRVPGRSNFQAAYHRFVEGSSDWGFAKFITLSELRDTTNGFLGEDNTVSIIAKVYLCRGISSMWVVAGQPYDSKKETGYVGLKNQGATCYMNSMLQALYFTNYLRKAVYQLPTGQDHLTKSVPLALQRVFYSLQTANQAVGTEMLTKSFGWNPLESFMQHDVQEFNRVLTDNLETKMKGTPVEGTINRLFEGAMKSYIKCIDVSFESSRIEPFYDIQLNVKGMGNIFKSFEDYVSVETLDGDNRYLAEGHGLQKARKGVIFQRLPPVLHLQLKRFEYDFEADAMVKVNDRFEFFEDIDLTRFVEGAAQGSEVYELQAVLVHAGDMHSGHYTVFLRPLCKGQWFKFDDDQVTKATRKEAIDDNYGSEVNPGGHFGRSVFPQRLGLGTWQSGDRRHTNAYMLVYVRRSELSTMLSPVGEDDVPPHLVHRFVQEAEDCRRKEREVEESHHFITVRLVTEDHFRANDSHGLHTDVVGPTGYGPGMPLVPPAEDREHDAGEDGRASQPLRLRVRRMLPWREFKWLVEERTGVAVADQSFWQFINRQNHTMRPSKPVTLLDSSHVVSLVQSMEHPLLFLGRQSKVVPALGPPSESVLLFFKYYDPLAGVLQYVGHSVVPDSQRIADLHDIMCEMAGLDPAVRLAVYEELKPERIELCSPDVTLAGAELVSGDILVFQVFRQVHRAVLRQVAEKRAATNQPRANYHPKQLAATEAPHNQPQLQDRGLMDAGGQIEETKDETVVETTDENMEIDKETDPPTEYPETVDAFFAHLTNIIKATIRKYADDPAVFGQNAITITIRKDMKYKELTEAIGEAVKTDPAYLRLYLHNSMERRPQAVPLRDIISHATVNEMASPQAHDQCLVLYYEVLDRPMLDFITKQCLQVVHRTANGTETQVRVFLTKESTAADLVTAVRIEIGDEGEVEPGTVIVEELHEGSIHHKLEMTEDISRAEPHHCTFRVHCLPPDVLAAMQNDNPNEVVVEVRHFHKSPHAVYGSPFYFVLRKGETFDITRPRLIEAAGTKATDAAKWKVAVASDYQLLANATHSSDSLFDLFSRAAADGKSWVGLDHPGPRQRSLGHVEASVVIYN